MFFKSYRMKLIVFIIVSFSLWVDFSVRGEAINESIVDDQEGSVKAIRVAYDPHLPPLQYIDDDECAGFNIDILQHIAELRGISVQYFPMKLEKSVQALKQGEVDVILGINFTATQSKDMEFTESYLASSVSLIAPKNHGEKIQNILELSETVVALQRGTVEYDFFQNVRRIKFNHTSNLVDAFDLMLQDRAQCFIGDRIVAQFLLREKGLEKDYEFVNSYIIPIEYSMAVQKENYSLLYTLNRGIQELKEQGIYSQIYDKWFYDPKLKIQERLETMLKILGVSIGGLAVVFLLSIRWNKQLKNEVDKKTKQLQVINQSLELQIQETKNTNELKNQILDSSPRGIVTCDVEGRILSFNPRAYEISGINYRPEGRRYDEVLLLKHLFEEKMKEVIEKGIQFLGKETEWERKDGIELNIRYYIYPLRDFEKKIKGTILTFEDVTEEKKLREEFFEKEKSRALNQIVASIAHEIRNPLTSIKTYVELIPLKFENQRFKEQILNFVPKEVERVNHLIESLIDYAKPKAVNQEIVSVEEMIGSCIVLFDPVLHKKGFKIEKDLEKGLKIEVDKNQIKQVMVNLILNGIDAMEEMRRTKEVHEKLILTIRSRKKGNMVWIEIHDQGIGMLPEEMKQIMNPFYTTKQGGYGLGLTISKQYIEENGGQIDLQSQKNEGTKVILKFEAKEDRNAENSCH